MNIQLIDAAFRQGINDVDTAAKALKTDRDRIDKIITGYVQKGWTGVAADSYLEAWEDWRDGADIVLDGLTTMGELLQAAHVDFTRQDAKSQAELDALSALIVARLGE